MLFGSVAELTEMLHFVFFPRLYGISTNVHTVKTHSISCGSISLQLRALCGDDWPLLLL